MLNNEPLWQLVCSDTRDLSPSAQVHPSQSTLSRLITCLNHSHNLEALHEHMLRLAIWRLNSLTVIKTYSTHPPIAVDIVGLPIEVFAHYGGSAPIAAAPTAASIHF